MNSRDLLQEFTHTRLGGSLCICSTSSAGVAGAPTTTTARPRSSAILEKAAIFRGWYSKIGTTGEGDSPRISSPYKSDYCRMNDRDLLKEFTAGIPM